jgi:hypothetical protein
MARIWWISFGSSDGFLFFWGDENMQRKVNLKESVDSLTELYTYLKVGQLNDHMLNVIQSKDRTLDFHIHPDSDEMFY